MLRALRVAVSVLSALVVALTGYGWTAYRELGARLVTSDVLTRDRPADGVVDILLVGLDSRTDAQGNPLPREVLEQLHTGGDNPRVLFILRHAHAALVRVRRKILNHTSRTLEQFVHRIDSRDLLIIAVRARMIIRPRDRFAFHIVAHVARLIGFLMLRVKEVRSPDSAQRTQRRA